MLKGHGIRATRRAVNGRPFLLWFVTIVLVAVAFAVSPAYAFAGEVQDIPRGILTLESQDFERDASQVVSEIDDTASDECIEQNSSAASPSLIEPVESEQTQDSGASNYSADETQAETDGLTNRELADYSDSALVYEENSVAEQPKSDASASSEGTESADNESTELQQQDDIANTVVGITEPSDIEAGQIDSYQEIPAEEVAAPASIDGLPGAPNAPPATTDAQSDSNSTNASSADSEGAISASPDVTAADDNASTPMIASGSLIASGSSVGTPGGPKTAVFHFQGPQVPGVTPPDKHGDTYIAKELTANDAIFDVSGNIICYANDSYTITFSIGDTFGEDKVPLFYRNGYKCYGFFEEFDGAFLQYNNGAEVSDSFDGEDDPTGEETIHYYVAWQVNPIDITFQYQGNNNIGYQNYGKDAGSPWTKETINIWESTIGVPFAPNADKSGIDEASIDTTRLIPGWDTDNFYVPTGYEFMGWMAEGYTQSLGYENDSTLATWKPGYDSRVITSASLVQDQYLDVTRNDEVYVAEVSNNLKIIPVYRKKPTSSMKYYVEYYETNADNASASLAKPKFTYTGDTTNIETLETLEIETPNKDDYDVSFAGWATLATLESGTPVITTDGGAISALSPSDGQTYKLYTIWTTTPHTFTVTYQPNGYSKTPVTKTYNVASAATTSVETVAGLWTSDRPGYIFEGWATELPSNPKDIEVSVGKTAKLSALSPAPSKNATYTLYAVWTLNQYTVTYNLDGGTATPTPEASYNYTAGTDSLATDAAGKSIPVPTKTGYTFGGWSTSQGGTAVVNTAGTITNTTAFNPSAGDKPTLYAVWTQKTYTINWNAEWGSTAAVTDLSDKPLDKTATSSIQYEKDASKKLSSFTEKDALIPADSRVKSGGNTFQFVGWYITKAAGAAWDTPATGTTALGDMTISQVVAALNTTGTTIDIYGIWTKLGAATITYMTNNKNDSSAVYHTDNPFAGDTYTVYSGTPADLGYKFTGWNTMNDGTGTTYVAGDTISNVQTMRLYAQWTENTVKFTLDKNTSDTNVDLHGKSNITSAVGQTVNESQLTSATPERTNYEFLGWALSASGKAADVIVGPTDSDKTYTVPPEKAPADGTNITLYAVWKEFTYTVIYNTNTGSDTANGVTFKKTVGGVTQAAPYTWTAKTKRSDSGLDTPDITATRRWYKFAGWGTTPGATTGIASTDLLGTLYDTQSRSDRILDLYAIWTPIEFTVNYVSADPTKGSVNPLTEKINLATGTDAIVQGSTATVTADGYELATPTWRTVDGNAARGLSNKAHYAPSIDYLHDLYDEVPGTESVTFYAHFTEAMCDYEVWAFMQKADGSYDSAYTYSWSSPGGKDLEAKLGTTISHTDVITGTGNSTVDGKALWELALKTKDTGGYSNQYLYEFDSSLGTKSFAIKAETAPALTDNILKLYYKRLTYALNVEFKTENASGTVSASAPSSVTTTPGSYVNGGNPTTALRWGESIPVSAASTTGYTFSWALTVPTDATSANPGSSFTLTAADMAKLVQASDSAVLTGTFKVITYPVTLKDPDANSTHNWTGGAADDLKSSSRTATTQVAADGSLGSWAPTTTDNKDFTHYFAGWVDDADPSIVIAPSSLKDINTWTGPRSFTARWLQKVVIVYDAGENDSFGNPKAAWATDSGSVQPVNPETVVLATYTGAKFADIIGSAALVDGNPKGAPGWAFAYWTIEGEDGKYGHKEPYAGTGANPGNLYVEGTTGQTGLYLNKSYRFIAHWVAVPGAATVTFENSGPIVNNPENTGTLTTVLQNPGKTYNLDDEVNLAEYEPNTSDVPNGYEFAGWRYEYTDAGGTNHTGEYAPGSKFNTQRGTIVLKPTFNEKTVTFTYELGSGSSEKGTIAPITSDTVFVVTHNGINDHTASSGNDVAYKFVDWTYNSSRVTDSPTIGATDMAIPADYIIPGDRTYQANFETKTYTLKIKGTGTDGEKTGLGTITISGPDDNSDGGFTVLWNTTLPNTNSITVTPPKGHVLGGWLVDSATDPVVFTGGNATNLQGVFNYVVTGDHTLTAYFVLDTAKNYTVHYNYDPEGLTGFTGTPSRVVSWGEDVKPTLATEASPTQAGYEFKGWYVDSAYAATVDSTGPDFGAIYDFVAGTDNQITIYAKWTAKSFTVAYDPYGNVPDDESTDKDDVRPASATTLNPKTVAWRTPASEFKISGAALTRGGYDLKGWKATVTNTESGTVETSTLVLDGDLYGVLAGNDDKNTTVTLRAIWESKTLTVEYDFNDAEIHGTATPKWQTTKGWAEEVNYYSLGLDYYEANAPKVEGYTFGGWEVKYVGKDETGNLRKLDGTSLTGPGNLTVRDITNNDPSAEGSAVIVYFKAIWAAQGTYIFQDVLVHVDGTTENKAATSTATCEGGSKIEFEKYGTPKTIYEGYDFDNFTASNPKFFLKTEPFVIVAGGTPVTYYVYYLERSYKIDFFKESTDSTGTWKTEGNAWDSAPVTLPNEEPKKAGYKFDGWYLQVDSKEALIDASTRLSSLTTLFATAPANGSTLTAVAKWSENEATIVWETAASDTAYGSTNPAAGSVTRAATDASEVASITATPSSEDYAFDKWTYKYTDENGNVKEGTVNSSSRFAELSGENKETLKPIQWKMGSEETATWHDITFTAHFALSSLLQVKIEYYLEDGNNPGNYVKDDTDTKRVEIVDGAEYTVTDIREYAGYTLNTGMSDLKHVYYFETESSHTYKVYYDADLHEIKYVYVDDADGSTLASGPTGAPLLSSFNNTTTARTGMDYTVSAAPTFADYTFKGWFVSGDYNGTNVSGTSIKVGDKDITYIGAWVRSQFTVNFVDDTTSEAYGAGARISQTLGGYKVLGGNIVATAVDPAATTLADLNVEAKPNGQPYTLTGWDVYINGAKVGDRLGASGPLSYEVHDNVDFRAVWSETYRVTYTRGLHGAFTDATTPSKTYVESPRLVAGDPMFEYNGTTSNGLPNAENGWEFVGWGSQVDGTWTYYFAHEDHVDYGGVTRSDPTAATKPSTVSTNIEFVGFYKALARTVVFSTNEYNGSPVGTESTQAFVPPVTISAPVSMTVYTGDKAAMLGKDVVSREGYGLAGWTDGTNTYTEGSTDEFVMPKLADGKTLYLYPVFGFTKIEIKYRVHDDSTGRGDVDRTEDTKSVVSDVIVGSNPVANAGYEFDYWTKDDGTDALTDTEGQVIKGKLVPTQSGTYYAHFAPKKYTLQMALNDDPAYEGETLPTTDLSGDKIWTDTVTLGTPTLNGYTFKGWNVYETSNWNGDHASRSPLHTNVSADTPTAISALSNPTGTATSLTFVPVWEAIKYAITFEDGVETGTTGAVSNMPVPQSDLLFTDNVDTSEPSRVGYTFAGWTTSVTGGPTTAAEEVKYSVLAKDDPSITSIVFTATWTPITHTLTYVASDDVSDDDNPTWSSNKDNYPEGDPAKDDATAAPNAINTATDAVINLRGATTISLPGFKLVGWTDGVNDYKLDSTSTFKMPNADVTLTPIWEAFGDYNVIFDGGAVDVGMLPANQTNIPFSKVIDAHEPSRAGYKFTGWTNSVTGEKIDASTDKKYSEFVNGDDTQKTLTLTANWSEADDYTVTFVANSDGEDVLYMPDSKTGLKWGSTVYTKVAGQSPKRSGYTFEGWTIKDKEGNVLGNTEQYPFNEASALFSALAYNQDLPARHDLTLEANWTAKKYMVEFKDNKPENATGEITGMPDPNPLSDLLYTAKNISVPVLTLEGYTFKGWDNNRKPGNTPTAGGDTYTYAELANNNDGNMSVTLTAIWEPIPHTLQYLLGDTGAWSTDGTKYPSNDPASENPSKAADVINTETGAIITLRSENTVTRDGFELQGWRDALNNTYYFGEGQTTLTMPHDDVTLFPIWKGKPYNLRYVLALGTWDNEKITDAGKDTPNASIEYGIEEIVTLRGSDTVKRDGYVLVGWATAETGGTEYRFTETGPTTFTMPASDVELFPLWDAKLYDVTFVDVPAGDTGTKPVTSLPANLNDINYDSNVTHGEPARVGYDFGGWDVYETSAYANPETAPVLRHVGTGTSMYSVLAGSPDIDAVTLVAVWTAKSYGVTYRLTDGQGEWVPANITDTGAANPTLLVGYPTDATVDVRRANTVTRSGYVLAGWKDSNAPGVEPTEYRFGADGSASFTMPADNVYLYPIWERGGEYTVTFVGNEPTTDLAPGATLGNMPAPNPQTGLEWDGPAGFVTITVPTFTGYKFGGWAVFDSNGDPVLDSTGKQIVQPGVSAYFNVLAGNVDSPAHKNLTLKAIWEVSELYNVKFLDGVEDSGDPDHPFTPVTSGTMPLDALGITYIKTVDYHAPSRLGYTFDGWDVKDITDPNNPFELPGIAAGDAGTSPYYQLAGNNPARTTLQLTAKWIAKKVYNVHFVDKPESDTGASRVNDGNFHTDFKDMEDIAWDATVVVYPEPTRAGYDFVQWAVTNTTDPENVKSIGKIAKEDIGTFLYSELAINYMTGLPDDAITHVTLTAIWKAHEWTVTYIVNKAAEGTGTWNKPEITDKGKNSPDNAMTFAVDDVVDLRLANTLRLGGYTLVGWQDDETDPTNIYKFDSTTSFTMPDANVKLYPIWEVKVYKVVFDDNKPAAATDPAQIVTGMPVTQWEKEDADYPMTWTGTVDTKHPSLPGYTFKGWTIENAELTGALVGLLDGTTYTFNQLAITDNDAHTTLKLIAQWEPAKYRVTYVDPVDANGAAVDPVTVITTDPTKLWGDKVAVTSPFEFDPVYTAKSEDDWEFVGWYVKDISGNMVLIGASDDTTYSVLAAREGLTLADSATDDAEPALVLYAGWTRRVPFIVDYVKRTEGGTVETVESNTTLTGLDGDDIATKWANTVLDLGDNHRIAGFKYNRSDSAPGIVGTLSASGETLHLVLYYDELLGYVVTYDAAPGKNAAGNTTADAASPAWDSPSTNFVPADGDWTYVGHKISHWTYGPTGAEYTFPAGGSSSLTFADIARAIFGDAADGSQGIDLNDDGIIDTPVVLHAVWVERTDYKVKYDDNYAKQDDKVKSGITDGRFLERTEGSTYKPGDKENVAWSAVDIEPTDIDDIVEPGVKDGIALYEIEGWNYLSKDGVQKPAEGMSFAEIVADMYVDEREPADNEITLYARWKEIVIELKYTPTMLQVDTNGNLVLDGSGNVIVIGNGGGTVSRSSETVSAVTGGNVSGAKLLAEGATATANPGYHFVGWRRVGDNTIVYAPGMNPATLSASSLLMAMATGGFNVLPDGTIEGASLYRVAQNADDGYWHGEEYQALFAQNEIAILHYDKNAEDATGSIPDVEEPAGSLLTLSDGSGFKRTYWTLVGWNTKPDGTGTPYALSEANWPLPTGETTLYAQWVKNKVKLVYEPNGTDVTGIPEGITDEWGTKHGVTTEPPKRKHYTFVGWNTKPDGTGTWYEGGEEVLLPGDGITLHAQWKINTYVVGPTEDPTPGGKVTGEPTEVEHGGYLPKGEIVAIPDPGYHVERWKYTMIDEDGNVITGYVNDPSELQIIGKVTFEPIFAEDEVDDGTSGMPSIYGGLGTETLVATGDGLLYVTIALAMVAMSALMLIVLAVRRRRESEDR